MIKTIASKLNLKRPKIVEQIVVVLFFAVLIPFVTIGFIISNVSQHTIRKELNYSATMLAQYVGENASLYHKLAPKDFESFDVILNKKLSGEKIDEGYRHHITNGADNDRRDIVDSHANGKGYRQPQLHQRQHGY